MDAGGIHCRPPAAGDLWSCNSTASPLAALDRISQEKGTALRRALFAISPGYRALRSPQTQVMALYSSSYRSGLEKDPPKSYRSFS